MNSDQKKYIDKIVKENNLEDTTSKIREAKQSVNLLKDFID